jgi:hypothetical protein
MHPDCAYSSEMHDLKYVSNSCTVNKIGFRITLVDFSSFETELANSKKVSYAN